MRFFQLWPPITFSGAFLARRAWTTILSSVVGTAYRRVLDNFWKNLTCKNCVFLTNFAFFPEFWALCSRNTSYFRQEGVGMARQRLSTESRFRQSALGWHIFWVSSNPPLTGNMMAASFFCVASKKSRNFWRPFPVGTSGWSVWRARY